MNGLARVASAPSYVTKHTDRFRRDIQKTPGGLQQEMFSFKAYFAVRKRVHMTGSSTLSPPASRTRTVRVGSSVRRAASVKAAVCMQKLVGLATFVFAVRTPPPMMQERSVL